MMNEHSENFEEQYEKLNALKRLKANMGLFGRVCLPSAISKAVPSFHNEIYSMLGDLDKKRVMVVAPRGTSKSTAFNLVYPMWRIAFKRSDEDIFIVIISESAAQSINFLSRIKYHLTNSRDFIETFGDYSERTAKRWTQNDIVLSNGVRIVAVGTGQRVRGFIEGDTRPTDIVIDDFESELNAGTPERRASNRSWALNAVFPSISDGGRILMVGTPISEDCFLYYARGAGVWNYRWYQICQDLDAALDGRTEEAGLLWEERFPAKRIIELKKEYEGSANLHGFYQEYMCIAQNPKEAPFQPEFFKYFEHELVETDAGWALKDPLDSSGEVIPIDIYMGIDPASSLSLKADFFVIAVVGVDAADNRYLIDIFRSRIPPSEQPEKIIEWYKRYKPRKVRIETVAYQEALRDGVRALMRKQGLFIPGLEKGVKPRTAKSERLIGLVPIFSSGKFYFRRSHIAVQSEFISFPRGTHDDCMDAIWTACFGLVPCKRKRASVEEKQRRQKSKLLDWVTA